MVIYVELHKANGYIINAISIIYKVGILLANH